jgi:hypothetical protein
LKKCPKCLSQYGDDLKICRTCGGILEKVAEEQPETVEVDPTPHDEDIAIEAPPAKQDSWTCSQCGQSVPGGFEVCWNCGTSQEGVPDPEFHKERGGNDAPLEIWQPREVEPVAKRTGRPCPRCGSENIIPNASILGRVGYSDGRISIVVDGDPDAMIFKDRLYDQLTADVCGECGHVELSAVHPNELYEHYLRSKSEGEA